MPGRRAFITSPRFADLPPNARLDARTLLGQTQQTRLRQIETRLHHVQTFRQAPLILAQLIQVGALDRVVLAQRFKRHPPTVVLLQQFLRVFDVGVGNAPAFREQVDVRKRRRRLRRDDARDRRQAESALRRARGFR